MIRLEKVERCREEIRILVVQIAIKLIKLDGGVVLQSEKDCEEFGVEFLGEIQEHIYTIMDRQMQSGAGRRSATRDKQALSIGQRILRRMKKDEDDSKVM